MLQGRPSDVRVVVKRLPTQRRVDDQRHLGVDHPVDDVGALVLVHLPHEPRVDAVVLEELARARRRDHLEAELRQVSGQLHDHRALVVVVHGDERRAAAREADAGTEERLRVGLAEARR